MNYIISKIQEWISNLWIKILFIIPTCFFKVDEKEKIMIFALLVIITIDCIFGMMKAKYVDDNFSFSKLSKKFSKKFLLFFFTLLASFIISKAYGLIGWWFYVVGAILTFSEFGSLLKKAKKLGLPIKGKYLNILNERMDKFIKGLLG